MNGFIKLNIGGKERGFKLGLYVLGEVLASLKINIGDIEDALKNNPIKTIASLMYNAAAYECLRQGDPVDFTQLDVFDWMDEAGGFESEPVRQFIECLYTSMSKNVPPVKDPKKKPLR